MIVSSSANVRHRPVLGQRPLLVVGRVLGFEPGVVSSQAEPAPVLGAIGGAAVVRASRLAF
jgi:hypothetical protein